jgi:tetratricopeptide (TPR) repeat protein
VVTVYARVVDVVDRYRSIVIAAAVALVLIVAGVVAYTYMMRGRADEAAALLGGVVGQYERGLYREALDGTVDKPGILEIARKYGRTPDGNLARYYAADALYRLGDRDEALRYFRSYDKGSDYLGASAYAGEAMILEDRGEFERAAEAYRRAATVYENELTSPGHLLAAARNFEAAGEYGDARRMYELIEERFPESEVAAGLDLYFARLSALEDQ